MTITRIPSARNPPQRFEHEALRSTLIVKRPWQLFPSEERRLTTWESVKGLVNDPNSALYSRRFLQIAVCPTPAVNFTRHLAGVTRRWNVPLALKAGSSTVPAGRDERRPNFITIPSRR